MIKVQNTSFSSETFYSTSNNSEMLTAKVTVGLLDLDVVFSTSACMTVDRAGWRQSHARSEQEIILDKSSHDPSFFY